MWQTGDTLICHVDAGVNSIFWNELWHLIESVTTDVVQLITVTLSAMIGCGPQRTILVLR